MPPAGPGAQLDPWGRPSRPGLHRVVYTCAMHVQPSDAVTLRRGTLLLLGGATLWGTTGTAAALGPAGASAVSVGTTRLVVGSALLVGWVAARRPASSGDAPALRASWPVALVGALGVAAYQLSFFAAVDTAGVALGTAVAIGSSPTMTGLLEWAVERRRPPGRWWAATALSSVGVLVLVGPSSLVPAGVALALLAGFSYATYAVAAKRLIARGVHSARAMSWVFGLGGLLLAPLVAVVDVSWLATGDGLLMVGWLAIMTILAAYLLYGAGLARLPVSTAATLSLAEPVTAAILGVVVVGERPTLAGAAGALLVLLGLAVVVRPPRSVGLRAHGPPAGGWTG